jgi:hypothetical protein
MKKTDFGERCRVAITGLEEDKWADITTEGRTRSIYEAKRKILDIPPMKEPDSPLEDLNPELLENADQLDQRQPDEAGVVLTSHLVHQGDTQPLDFERTCAVDRILTLDIRSNLRVVQMA